jgi:hypothetical protein
MFYYIYDIKIAIQKLSVIFVPEIGKTNFFFILIENFFWIICTIQKIVVPLWQI